MVLSNDKLMLCNFFELQGLQIIKLNLEWLDFNVPIM